MRRTALYVAVEIAAARRNLAPDGGPPNLRGEEREIEILVHELAHAAEIGLEPQEESSRVIHYILKAELPRGSDRREIRALAIEVLVLHRLGYKIRVNMLARYTELWQPSHRKAVDDIRTPNSARTSRYIERAVRRNMQRPDIKALADA